MKHSHILVTGGAGFIGSHIANRLLRDGYRVTVLDDLSTGHEGNIPKDADFIEIDLGQNDQYLKIDDINVDAIFHLAGQSSGEASFLDPQKDFRSHVVSSFNLLEWCRRKSVGRFIYASSMGVYGDPTSLPVTEQAALEPKSYYGAAKASAENYIRTFSTMGINTTIFRLFNVYGPGQNFENKMQGMVSIYLSFMLDGNVINVKGSKERFRDFLYIDDCVEAWMRSYENDISYGQTYNLASGQKTSVEDLIEILRQEFGQIDYPVEYVEGTQGDQFCLYADVSRIQNDLNWVGQMNLNEGIGAMIKSARKGVAIG